MRAMIKIMAVHSRQKNHVTRNLVIYKYRSVTLLTAGALTDPQLPAIASNMCTTDARLGGVGRVPPNKNPTTFHTNNFFVDVVYDIGGLVNEAS